MNLAEENARDRNSESTKHIEWETQDTDVKHRKTKGRERQQ